MINESFVTLAECIILLAVLLFFMIAFLRVVYQEEGLQRLFWLAILICVPLLGAGLYLFSAKNNQT